MGWMEDEEAVVVMKGTAKPVLNAYKQRLEKKNTPI